MIPLVRIFAVTTALAPLYGCARSAPPARHAAAADSAALAVYREHASRPAAALVFAPPLLQDAPPVELSRDVRQPSAFVGYPEAVAEFFYVRWDDSQIGGQSSNGHGHSGSGFGDRYERRAISEKVGVLYR